MPLNKETNPPRLRCDIRPIFERSTGLNLDHFIGDTLSYQSLGLPVRPTIYSLLGEKKIDSCLFYGQENNLVQELISSHLERDYVSEKSNSWKIHESLVEVLTLETTSNIGNL